MEPALRRAPDDPELLRIAAEAALASGAVQRGAQYYERAVALDKANVGGRVRLAQVRLATGDTERAFKDLEALAKQDSPQHQADLALILAQRPAARVRQGAGGGRRAGEKGPGQPGRAESSRRDLHGEARFQGRARELREVAGSAAERHLRRVQPGGARRAGGQGRGRAQALREAAGEGSEQRGPAAGARRPHGAHALRSGGDARDHRPRDGRQFRVGSSAARDDRLSHSPARHACGAVRRPVRGHDVPGRPSGRRRAWKRPACGGRDQCRHRKLPSPDAASTAESGGLRPARAAPAYATRLRGCSR